MQSEPISDLSDISQVYEVDDIFSYAMDISLKVKPLIKSWKVSYDSNPDIGCASPFPVKFSDFIDFSNIIG